MRFFFIAFLFCLTACRDNTEPVQSTFSKDSVKTTNDTVFLQNALQETNCALPEYLDSIFKLSPIAVMKVSRHGYYYENLIARFIDTTPIKKIPLVFSDTVINKFNTKDEWLSTREINRNQKFTIEICEQFPGNYNPRKFFINGKELRPGIELDTSHAGDFFLHNLEINSAESFLLQMGNKAYLLLRGFVHQCNGISCSVNYSILYDIDSGKAMLDEQYMTPLCLGFDKTINSPVFIDHYRKLDYLFDCNVDQFSGKLYRWDPQHGIRPLLNNKNKQFQFEGYHKVNSDSLILTSVVFPGK